MPTDKDRRDRRRAEDLLAQSYGWPTRPAPSRFLAGAEIVAAACGFVFAIVVVAFLAGAIHP